MAVITGNGSTNSSNAQVQQEPPSAGEQKKRYKPSSILQYKIGPHTTMATPSTTGNNKKLQSGQQYPAGS